jgi:SET domain-containing protein
MAPRHWPKSFVYSRESISPNINLDFLRFCLSSENPHQIVPLLEEKKTHPDIKLLPLSSKHLSFHPLLNSISPRGHVQRAVFAQKLISAGTLLGEFVGEISLLSKEECSIFFEQERPSEYSWIAAIKNYLFFVEPRTVANELAFINDFRGIKEQPNVTPQWIVHRGSYHFVYVTKEEIQAGDELLVDYGDNYWMAWEKSTRPL